MRLTDNPENGRSGKYPYALSCLWQFMGSPKIEVRKILTDPSFLTLLLANLYTIFLALSEKWNLSTVIWIYWGQTLIICLFNSLRITKREDVIARLWFDKGKPLSLARMSKIKVVALIFLIFYGPVLFVYGFILLFFIAGTPKSSLPFLTAILFLFLNHLFSYIYNRKEDISRLNDNQLLFRPYLRMLPIHLIAGLGMFFFFIPYLPMVVFLLLKTLADLLMHALEHAETEAGAAPVTANEQP